MLLNCKQVLLNCCKIICISQFKHQFQFIGMYFQDLCKILYTMVYGIYNLWWTSPRDMYSWENCSCCNITMESTINLLSDWTIEMFFSDSRLLDPVHTRSWYIQIGLIAIEHSTSVHPWLAYVFVFTFLSMAVTRII